MPLTQVLSITAMNVPAIEFHKSFRPERFAKDGVFDQAKSIKGENVKKIIAMGEEIDCL
ncbi:hypothetical protein KX729_20645 [Rhizobium sp. XQZ8]|uniref:hypothetical protein n=1 Tax=Rhizobium populisoli TaxID=2859785 RepID=UPI001CA51350|nr:hypothetical protein [Rhizobium populisoli]MBW6423873.1 hypothetical protein [Rhizobium populisoli]